MVGDFSLLIPVSGKVLFFPFFFLNQEIVKVTAIAKNLTITDLKDACTNGIQEGPIMRNGKDGPPKILSLVPETIPRFQDPDGWLVRPASEGPVP